MRAFMVVAVPPVFGHAANLLQTREDIAVQNFRAIRAVKSFDIGILCRLAGLDELQLDAVLLCPLSQRMTDEFGAVVGSQATWLAANLDQFIQGTDDARCRQAGIDVDAQRLPVVIVNDIESAKATT